MPKVSYDDDDACQHLNYKHLGFLYVHHPPNVELGFMRPFKDTSLPSSNIDVT